MAKVGSIKLVNQFADDSTRAVELGPIDVTSDAFVNAKANIKAIDPSTIASVYLSDNGASYTGVAAATLVEIETTEYNLNAVEEETGGEG